MLLRQTKSSSDTNLVCLSLRQTLFSEIRKYLATYHIFLCYFKHNNYIQLQSGLKQSDNILLSGDSIYIYEHSQIIIGYYVKLDTFLRKFRANAYFENGRDILILSMETNSNLYKYCLENYANLFDIEPSEQNPDIKLFVKLYRVSEEEIFFLLDL